MCDGTKLILSRQRENIQMKIEERGTKKLFARRIRNEKKNKKKLKLKFFFTEKRRRYYQNRGKKRERERIQLLQFWYELGKDNITSRLSQIHKLLKGEGNICVFLLR